MREGLTKWPPFKQLIHTKIDRHISGRPNFPAKVNGGGLTSPFERSWLTAFLYTQSFFNHETDIQSIPYPPRSQAWLPRPQSLSQWTKSPARPSCPRTQAPGPLIFALRDKPAMGIARKFRLRQTSEHERIRSQGLRANASAFVMLWAPSRQPFTQGAVVASRRVGGAVERNRAKRMLREVFRQNRDCLPPTSAVILIARKQIHTFTLEELSLQFRRAANWLRHQAKTGHPQPS